MIARVLLTALIAGFIAGLAVTGVQSLRVLPLIHKAEQYERAEAAHAHAPVAWAPADGMERTLFTALANVIAGVGFAALLAAAFVLYGRPVGPAQAPLWGLAGFAAFSLLPAIGLAPEVPGMAVADLAARQLWWWGAVTANCVGLALIVFARWPGKALGVIAIAVPFIVGAPQPPSEASAVPAGLASHYAAAALGTALLFWLVLAVCAAWVYERSGRAAPRPA